jgi:hypothetical protein
MHEPVSKSNALTEINRYREACRNLVANHSKLKPNHKVVLMRLTDYVNRHSWDAFVGEEKLADGCRVSPRTVRRALKAGKALGIIERTVRGNKGKGASRHVFRVASQPDTPVLLNSPDISQPDKWGTSTGHGCPSQPDTGVLRASELTSEEHLRGAPPSPPLESGAVVAKEEKKGVGEEGSGLPVWTTPSLEATEYTPELRKLYERAKEVYTPGPVPRRYWRKRRQTPEEFDAEMATRGVDMSASRRRSGGTGFQAHVQLNDRHSA